MQKRADRIRCRGDEAGEGRRSDRRLLSEDKIIAGLGLLYSREGRVVVAIRPSGLPVLKKNESAAAGNGTTTAANASAAIPVRAFKGMSDWLS